MNRFYLVMRTIAYPIIKLLYPFTVEGLEHVPQDQSVVLCANHASAWDPILICMALPKRYRIRIMAKKQLTDIPVLGWLLKKIGVFPVDRGHADLHAVKTSIRAIQSGENLLIFPEGTRVEHAGDARVKGGVVMIALRTGAALLPVSVGGKKQLFHRSRIVFGEPWKPVAAARRGTAAEYQAYADEIMRQVYALDREEK